MPDIYLLTKGEREGPYSEEQIRQFLAESRISSDHPAWHEGLDDWIAVGNIVANSTESNPGISLSSEGDITASDDFHESLISVPLQDSRDASNMKRINKDKLIPRSRFMSIGVTFLLFIIFGLSVGIGIGLVSQHAIIHSVLPPSVPPPALFTASSRQTSSATQTTPQEPTVAATTPDSTVAHNRVWFKVYEPAQEPSGAWFGRLVNEATGVTTDIIVDFGKELDLGQDDRLEGVYVPTSETGQWNHTPFRVYHLQGEYKMVDPLSVQQ